mgnify:CR=1 FL=1
MKPRGSEGPLPSTGANDDPGLQILSWNIAGAKTLLEHELSLEGWDAHDIILLQETWALTPLPIQGYVLHHKEATKSERSRRPTGGLAVYVAVRLAISSTQVPTTESCLQIIKLELNEGGKSHFLLIFNVYAHPSKNVKEKVLTELIERITEARSSDPRAGLIISGDFNLNLLYTPEDDEILAMENEYWAIPPQHDLEALRKNRSAEKLVTSLEHQALRVVNGRLAGDIPPRFTFHSANRRLIIDFTLLSLPLMTSIRSFSIIPTADSDHPQ